jgi:hypothetical protein
LSKTTHHDNNDYNNNDNKNNAHAGAQKWVLFPPHVTPPGVHPLADGLDLATPVTLAEWFEGFYTEAARGPVGADTVGWFWDVVFGGLGGWRG